MIYARDALNKIPRFPSWVTSARAETPEDVAFLSGAALSHLHLVLSRDDVPQTLLRARLGLKAAEASVTHLGRPERAGELRDAVTFLQPGDSPGPAGEITLSWQRAVDRPVSIEALHRALPNVDADQIAMWLAGYGSCDEGVVGQGAPVAPATSALEAVREDRPRDHTAALLLAQAALAQALGWPHVVPLLALGLMRGDLRKIGEDLHLACHRRIVTAAVEVTREAADLSRRAARLQANTPKLRAKGAGEAVAMFLNRDAVAPTALTSLRFDRAARRFCDRLVALGAVRELTGRDTFRLYGIREMAKDHTDQPLDRELEELPADLRWREWMRRIEAVLFASASPVPHEDLARVVGQGVSVDLLIEDLIADLEGRSFEVAKVASGWMLRTRPAYAVAIRTAADIGDQDLDLRKYDVAVLAAIAYHQPVTRDGLKDIFGKEISRDLIGRLHAQGLIGTGPRSPRRGAPYTNVTTEKFLIAFDMETLQDLPDREQLADAGLAEG